MTHLGYEYKKLRANGPRKSPTPWWVRMPNGHVHKFVTRKALFAFIEVLVESDRKQA